MEWPKSVSRWVPVIRAELSRTSNPLPVELVLSIIKNESNGYPGVKNTKSGASGLMQVMPATLQTYNQNNPAISLSTMRSKSMSAGPEQIRVGLWVVGKYWKNAYGYLDKRLPSVPIDELGRIAHAMYAAGPAATRKRLDKLAIPNWDSVQAVFPQWGALRPVRKVYSRLSGLSWPIDAINEWLGEHDITTPKPPTKSPETGFALAAIVMLLGWWFLQKKR